MKSVPGNRGMFFSLLPSLILLSCGLSGENEGGNKVLLRLSAKSAAFSSQAKMMKTSVDVGSVSEGDLLSYKCYITQIRLFQSLGISGSGYSGGTGSLVLFNNMAVNTAPYDSFDADEARKTENEAWYYDFMDSVDLAGLSATQELTSTMAGDYNYVVVDWMQPMKIRAECALSDGGKLYTHDGEVVRHMYQEGTPYYNTYPSTPLTASPAEEMVVRHNNGGTWFKFLKPLSIKETDFAANLDSSDTVTGYSPAFEVMLVFNPDGIIFGADTFDMSGQASGRPSGMFFDANVKDTVSKSGMWVPFLQASAIAYRQGETVIRESYILSVTDPKETPARQFDVRLDIFTLREDSSNVYAAALGGIVNASGQFPVNAPTVFSVSESTEGLSFYDWQDNAIISKFNRLSTVGESGTADYLRSNDTTGVIAGVPYTYIDKRALN